MRKWILVAAFSALLLGGCPAGGFFGRYVVINSTESTVSNLSLSTGGPALQRWGETLPGQAWIHSKAFGLKSLAASWTDDTGNHNVSFSFETKIGYRSHADLFVELKPHGQLAWRIIEPPAEDGKPITLSAVPIYVIYCVVAALVVGVPLALACALAYGLFKVISGCMTATIRGLEGDHTVFQFTIREIFMLMTMIAISLAWLFHSLPTDQQSKPQPRKFPYRTAAFIPASPPTPKTANPEP